MQYVSHTSVISASASVSIHRWERDGIVVAWGIEEHDMLCIFKLAIFVMIHPNFSHSFPSPLRPHLLLHLHHQPYSQF